MDKIFDNDGFVNYAEDAALRSKARDIIFPAYRACKINRRPMELDWFRYLKIWAMKRGDRQSYAGRADLRHATPRRAVETVSRKLRQLVLPENDYLTILPKPGLSGTTERSAEGVQNLITSDFDGPSQLRLKMIPHFRQKTLLGTSVIKSGWAKDVVRHRFRGKYKDVVRRDCPNNYTVDLFRWYAFPWNVRDIGEVKMCFEEFAVDEQYIKKQVEDKNYIEGHELAKFTKYTYDQQARLLQWGHNDPSVYRNHNQDVYNLVECYFEMEIEGELLPLMAHMDEFGNIAMITDHPYDHCEMPYSVDQYVQNQVPFIYGIGAMEIMESLATQQNDTMNQVMDNKTMLLNPIVLIDPYKVRDHASIKMAPMAKWLADPDGIRFMTMPDITGSGLQAFQLIKNEILECSDAVPNLPPQMRGAGRTTSRDRAVEVEMNAELSEFIDQSCMCFEDMLRKTHSNYRQFISDEKVVRVLKKNARDFTLFKVTPEDICGDYDFLWRGATKSNIDRVQTQQLINLMKVMKDSGANVDIDYVWRKILKNGFGFDDAEAIMNVSDAPSVDQDVENEILKMGRPVPISHGDDDQQHLQVMAETFGDDAKFLKLSKEVQHAVLDHKRRHEIGIQTKQQVAEQAIQQARMQMMQQRGMMPNQPGQPSPETTSGTPYEAQNESEGGIAQGMRVQ